MSKMRHSLYFFLSLLTSMSLLAGGVWLWTGLLVVGGNAILLDLLLPHDLTSHDTKRPWFLNFFLALTLPLVYLNIVLFNWQLSPYDFLHIGATVEDWTGFAVIARKADHSLLDLIGAYSSLALLTASGATTVAHELVHRIWNPSWLVTGRWLLAPTVDTSFSIEHVHGHHANVATRKDPASSRRGENVFLFFLRSTVFCNVNAWAIEKKRLEKRHKSGPWTYRNVFLRGQLMSLAVLLLYVSAQGSFGVASFFIMAVYGKFYLEMVNFIEHYGLVRVPGSPVEVKHSWNSNNRFSLWVLQNLPRHSHHHAKGHLPFWKLQPNPDAPTLPYGYLGMILLALCPPLFRSVMKEPLAKWDQQYANSEELALLKVI